MISKVVNNSGRGTFSVTFDLSAYRHRASQIVVTGSFNHWKTTRPNGSSGLRIDRSDQTEVTIELEPGEYEYKYYDTVRGEWLEVDQEPEVYERSHAEFVANPFGTLNRILRLETK